MARAWFVNGDDRPARGATRDAALVVIGVLLGSTTWWLDLTSVVGTFRTRLTLSCLERINVVSGVILAAFAIVAIATAVAA